MSKKKNKAKQLIRVILDTNILVSSLMSSEGNPAKIVTLVRMNKLQLYYNTEILNECNRVLRYPRLQIMPHEISIIVGLLSRKGIVMEAVKSDIKMLDESDRVFYDLHKTAMAILITGNARHYPSESTIMTPVDFLTKYFPEHVVKPKG